MKLADGLTSKPSCIFTFEVSWKGSKFEPCQGNSFKKKEYYTRNEYMKAISKWTMCRTKAGLEITIQIWVFVRKTCLRISISAAMSWFPIRKTSLSIYLTIQLETLLKFHHHFWVSLTSGNPVISSLQRYTLTFIVFGLKIQPVWHALTFSLQILMSTVILGCLGTTGNSPNHEM